MHLLLRPRTRSFTSRVLPLRQVPRKKERKKEREKEEEDKKRERERKTQIIRGRREDVMAWCIVRHRSVIAYRHGTVREKMVFSEASKVAWRGTYD